MHGPCPPRKGKVCHSRHDCGARGRVRGRGAVCRCAGLVPHERVKSVIRDTIAARRCQAVRSRVRERGKRAAARLDERAWCCQAQAARGPRTQRKVKSGICDTIAAQRCQAVRSRAWEWGKRAAQPGGSRSGVEAWGKRAAARPGERARCGRAMHGLCPPRKGKVCHSRHDCGARGRVRGRGAVCRCAGLVPHERVKSVIRDTIAARRCRAMRRPCSQRNGKVRHPRHDCGAALSGGSQSGVDWGQASGAARRFAVRRGSGGKRAARGRLSRRGAVGRCTGLYGAMQSGDPRALCPTKR